MIRISTRFAVALVALLGAAAGLRIGVLHEARGLDRCAAPGAMKATSLIPGTVALGERLEALDDDTIQWSEGELPNPAFSKLPMQFQIIRSYDAPALYANPLAYAVWPPAVAPDGAFYAWADCSRWAPDSWDFAFDLMRRAQVAITPGRDFGHHGAHRWVRFSYANAMPLLQEAVERLRALTP